MAEVYFYVPTKDSEHIVECGLKLSQFFEREVLIENTNKKCFSALLNPKDDMVKFNDESLKCIKLDLPSEYCFVADKYLYEVALNIPELMEFYYKSIIPVKNYKFGLYRLPECLVTTTVIPGQISILNKPQDIPVLFNCSEELYINNLIEINKDLYSDFDDIALYHFYTKLVEHKKNIRKIVDKNTRIAIFIDEDDVGNGKVHVIKIPEYN